MSHKHYILRAVFIITEVHELEEQELPGNTLEHAANMATRVLSGVPMVAPMMMQANQYEMQKTTEIYGSGISTVAAVMKRLDEALESIALEMV